MADLDKVLKNIPEGQPESEGFRTYFQMLQAHMKDRVKTKEAPTIRERSYW